MKVILKLENATITKCCPDFYLMIVTATVQRGNSLKTKTRVSKNEKKSPCPLWKLTIHTPYIEMISLCCEDWLDLESPGRHTSGCDHEGVSRKD